MASSPLPGTWQAPAPAADLAAAEAAFTEALAKREAGDLTRYRAGIERAASLLPDPTRLLYRLAAARLLTGDRPGAVAAFRRQVDAGYFRDPRADPEFGPLLEDPDFRTELTRLDALKSPLSASTEAFRLAERDLLVEGIAHDPVTGDFYLSSVHRRKIVRRSADGRITHFASLAGRLPGSPLGMAIDGPGRRLWVVTAGLPHGHGLPESEKNRAALAAFALPGGELVESVVAEGEGHLFNDLARASNGTIYVSDPGAGALWRRRPGADLERIAPGAPLRSPGGLALSADERLLFVADWSNGLAVVELDSGAFSWLAPPAGSTLLGIDGLLRHGDALVAIQNGVVPARITRFELAGDGRSLVAARLLERALPEWDEPTLGVAVGGELWYVANSHWPAFGEDGATPASAAELSEPAVRRLPLGR